MGSSAPRPDHVESDKDFFSGNRRNARRICVMPVECAGKSGPFLGRTVDVSRRGVLIEVRDPKFPASENGLVEFGEMVAREFPGAFPVRFTGSPLVAEVKVARVLRHPWATSLLIGCEFSTPLNDRQCRVLGVPTEEPADDASAK